MVGEHPDLRRKKKLYNEELQKLDSSPNVTTVITLMLVRHGEERGGGRRSRCRENYKCTKGSGLTTSTKENSHKYKYGVRLWNGSYGSGYGPAAGTSHGNRKIS